MTFRHEKNEEQLLRYIEQIQKLIATLLFKSEEFQTLKNEMESEGFELQEGIFTFLAKEPPALSYQDRIFNSPVEYEFSEEDKILLQQWRIASP